ncbi:MAG: hypothetical protein ABL891_19365, partial [Burkholderiales bacterium]
LISLCQNTPRMRHLRSLLALVFFVGTSHAAEIPSISVAPAKPANNLRVPNVTAVTSSGPGQAGYIHYFLITHPDESLEYHVGVELEDQRVAWSFPNAGVIVSEFIKKSVINANGIAFKIEHLHGIRPFANDAQMRALQKELPKRVAQWVDNKTPYCLFRKPGEPFCLSCGDFAVRILYPGTNPFVPALPRDFHKPGTASSTDDLLLYLVGIHNLPDTHAKLARLATLDLPANMRADIMAMIEEEGPQDTQDTAIAVITPSPVPVIAKPSPAAPVRSRIASRRPQSKKL